MGAIKSAKSVLVVWRLAACWCSPGDMTSEGVPAPHGAWREGVLHQAIDPTTMDLWEAWRLAVRRSR